MSTFYCRKCHAEIEGAHIYCPKCGWDQRTSPQAAPTLPAAPQAQQQAPPPQTVVVTSSQPSQTVEGATKGCLGAMLAGSMAGIGMVGGCLLSVVVLICGIALMANGCHPAQVR
jgi:predicted lipid-binding transport protein (Tim44 family)